MICFCPTHRVLARTATRHLLNHHLVRSRRRAEAKVLQIGSTQGDAPAPFSIALMAAFLTQVGALQTAPILIAVVTSLLTMEAVKYLLASRQQARAAAAKPAAQPEGD